MFTGLVERVGVVRSISGVNDGWSLEIECDHWDSELELGESIAVQGACLTVTSSKGGLFSTDLLDETMERTTLRNLCQGAKVNLERALAVGARLGGHIVSGHVDETGILLSANKRGRDYELRIGCSTRLAGYSVLKGSITIDGISLTISALGDDWLEVNVIPRTWETTTLSSCNAGDMVNLEGDIIGKYIARLMGKDSAGGITEKLLRESGFC